MTINEARSKLTENQYLIGRTYQGTPIADILIVPKGVGLHFITAIEELSEQEEDYAPLLADFRNFVLVVTFSHPHLQALALDIVLAGPLSLN
jgi:hypothetical protein